MRTSTNEYEKSSYSPKNRLNLVKITLFFIFILSIIACEKQEDKNPIEGVWELHYATYAEPDTTWVITKDKWHERKVFTKKHFFWMGQEPNRPAVTKDFTLSDMFKDAEPFIAGGGTYELDGNKYIEHAEFNIHPNFEKQTMTFNYRVNGDSLIITGTVPLGDIGMDYSGNEDIYEVLIRIE